MSPDNNFQEADTSKTLDFLVSSEAADENREIVNIASLLNSLGDSTPNNNTLSRFELGDEIGRGGMGEVHSCSDIHLDREVVAKVLHRKYLNRPAVLARFLEEIRITGRLEHSGVVPLYEAGILPDGRPYFVMQRIWGLTLRAVLDERPNPYEGRNRLLHLFEQICHTMAYAHVQRIIHRDLNPSNVMIGLFGQVKVMDWGLAKALDESSRTARELTTGEPSANSNTQGEFELHTQVGSVMGTPAYMPPEQAAGNIELLDERCDVFGLGAILCEILTGLPPYIDPNHQGLLRLATQADLSGAYARLDASRADGELIAIAKTCLAHNPADRPRDAGVVVDRLGNYFDTILRQAEWDLVRFFDLSLDLFCIAGFDGRFRRINENFSRVLGYSSAELLANPFLDYVHPDDQSRTIAVMGQLSDGLSLTHFRNRYRDIHGVYRWFEWTAKSIPKDEVIFAVAREVTEQVAMEERLKSAP